MTITDIRIRKLVKEGRLRAIVSITIDNALAIHDIKVIEGPNRLFVAMPSRREDAGTYRDIIHPITPDARTYFEESILEAYEKEMILQSIDEEAAAARAAETSTDAMPTTEE